MDFIKDAVSMILTTLLCLAILLCALAIAWMWWTFVHPVLGVVVGLGVFVVSFYWMRELSCRIGRNLGRYGHVFDLRE